MAQSHLLVLPEQELAVLLRARRAPHIAALFAKLPVFRVSLDHPLDEEVDDLANDALQSISDVQRNTNFPEDGYMPGAGGDGPNLSVCIDCGRVQDAEYPLSDKEPRKRIAKYNEESL